YIRRFHDKTIIIKYGGNAMTEPTLKAGFRHRIAAIFDDDGLVVETPDVGQRFGKDLRLERGVDGVDGHGERGRTRKAGEETRGLYSEPAQHCRDVRWQ